MSRDYNDLWSDINNPNNDAIWMIGQMHITITMIPIMIIMMKMIIK